METPSKMLKNLKEFSLPAVEEKVLTFWRANHVFEKSLAKSSKLKPKTFVFYEGPPTANGRPGIHHVLARAFKDVIPRYKTMRGFHVPRKGGWDTHGLPVEIEVEKALGLKSKKEIEKFGIAAFNAKCKESVWQYKDEWERLTERMGFWLDLKHPYITYENRYMEAVWGILKEVWKKKLLYRGHKVVPWCPRCGTGLSSHELALGYETVEDTSVYVKFKLKAQSSKLKASGNTYILSWTTTPWTLPGNVALAVGKNITYSVVKSGGENYVVAEERIAEVFKNEKYEILKEIKGKDLVGLRYEPLFEIDAFRSSRIDKSNKNNKAYRVYAADFVTTEDGTGVVHTAVMYGEDDYQLGLKVGLPARHTVDEAGKFTDDVKGFAGMFVKAVETEKKIIEYLEKRGLLFKIEKYQHEYPFCWRCQTPLLYYARDSWFIAMSKLRAKLIAENKKINWVPAHLREGRFGEWLREVKDWAISRSRYWGTPLPIWECEKCGAAEVFGSAAELGARLENRGNRFIIARHGFSESNLGHHVSGWPEKVKHHLLPKGRAEVGTLAKRLMAQRISAIYASPVTRTRESAELIAATLKIKQVTFDERLVEVNTGDFNGCHDSAYQRFFTSDLEKFSKRPPGGETLTELRMRVWNFLREINERHLGENILVVSHEYPIWMMAMAMRGWSEAEAVAEKHARGRDFLATGAMEEMKFTLWPRDESGMADLHRPYVDDIVFACAKCADGKAVEHPRRSRDKKGTMKRVPEVLDVWFDSGAMPFAGQMSDIGYQMSDSKRLKSEIRSPKSEIWYPADYISEGVDQTRGWFYTLHAIGVLMGKGRAYKNVISLGLVLDKNGQKMSKSKGNVVDPWAMIEKYGIDAVRWYLYTVNPSGEPKKFDEAEIGKTLRQFLMLVYNSWLFYDTYADRSALKAKSYKLKTSHVLDQWIVARLTETTDFATKSLEKYEVGEAARAIEAFAGDLSRWYIRRSRRRLQKPDPSADGQKDYRAASATLGYVLTELSKLIAPFAPFFAEALYQSVGGRESGVGSRKESVHLENWPVPDSKLKAKNSKLLSAMEEVRRLASMGLAVRAEKNIKVRQPLAEMRIKNGKWKNNELLEILADEVNVKRVSVDPELKEELFIDVNITHELLEEGWFRELTRTVQGMRQDAELTPKDAITVYAEVPEELAHVLRTREAEFKREVNAAALEFKKTHRHNVELQTKIGEFPAWLAVRKI